MNVSLLTVLVATAQQDDELLAFTGKIKTVPWTVVNAHFGNAAANRSYIAEMSF